jgi:hypothetical protein
MTQGKGLHEKDDASVGREGRGRLSVRGQPAVRSWGFLQRLGVGENRHEVKVAPPPASAAHPHHDPAS